MLFNSLTFFLFFALVLALHALPLRWSVRKTNLLVASYLFYAAWSPPFVLVLWLTTLVDWFVANAMARAQAQRRRGLLLISLAANLGLLAFFKYGGFLLDTMVAGLRSLGIAFQPAAPDIVLPVGISFYTFVTLSYTIDVYRGRIAPAPSFVDYALLVTFFPHLVAGPILRAASFLPQCREPRPVTPAQLGWGVALITIGLFEKVVLADRLLARVANQVYAAPAQAGLWDAWLGTLAFSGQIFFDFDGYSLCAIGVALCLGFSFPDNFRFPYAAVGFSDFWRRWHVSLSSWLRDYLYVSLGGNRCGEGRTYVNLMLTMLIGGLWHGAAWRFVVWGGVHGLFLVAERLVRRACGAPAGRTPRRGGARPVLALATFLLVSLAWVFFRSPDLASAVTMLGQMFAGSNVVTVEVTDAAIVLAVITLMLIQHWSLRDASLEGAFARLPSALRPVLLAALLVALAISPGDPRAFIYFQF